MTPITHEIIVTDGQTGEILERTRTLETRMAYSMTFGDSFPVKTGRMLANKHGAGAKVEITQAGELKYVFTMESSGNLKEVFY